MSSRQPTRCYVYQPGSATRQPDPSIFALGGPGSEPYRRKRFTRAEAERLCERVNASGQFEPCCECGEDYPRVDLLDGEIYCPKCREAEKARKRA